MIRAISPLRASCRLLIYFLWTVVCIPVQAVLLLVRSPLRRSFPTFYHRRCLPLLGIDLQVRGAKSGRHPVLFLSNHSSYIDITILGALVNGSFVAKSEVAGWPFFGLLAKLQRTVFVDRRARFVAAQREAIMERLRDGDDLILFPEGTSSDGNRVLPFKSALLSAAEIEIDGKPITVQPVSISYTRLDGIPLGRHLRPFYAWYGDMDMASHIWQMAGLGQVTVVVEFHQPMSLADVKNRKILADRCWRDVAAGVSSAITGHPQRPEDVVAM